MEFAVLWLWLWFTAWPKSFGRHLGKIARAMREGDE